MPFDVAAAVGKAEERIRPHIRETPVEPSPRFEEISRQPVWMKLENLQHTGSFKLRGAVSRLSDATREELERGVVAASTGNHGAAVAYAAGLVGTKATIYVPQGASPTKLRTIERLGGRIEFRGDDCIEAERSARLEAEARGKVYVSPYNDPEVVAGQGTVGVELGRQAGELDSIFVSVGGGGLIGGIAGYLSRERPDVRVIGCSPANSAVMAESVRAGHVVDLASLPTLSDGTAGGVETDSITFDLCRDLVDDWVLVSEEEIRDAMLEFMEAHHYLVEGAAGVALAAFLKMAQRQDLGQSAVVICGGNIALDTLRDVLAGGSR